MVTAELLVTSDGSSSGKRGGGGGRVSYDGLVPVHKEL